MTIEEDLRWTEKKLKLCNYWVGMAKDEEERRALAESELFKIRNENVVLKHENAQLRHQVDELFPLIEQLEAAVKENQSLAKELNKRNVKENPYGLSTPSSKRIDKKNSSKENQKNRGGAKKGHKGKGRKGFSKEEADQVVKLDVCPEDCKCKEAIWYYHSTHSHCVRTYVPAKIKKVYFEKTMWECSGCGRLETTPTPGVAPGGMYSDRTIANMLVEHYIHGHTVGEIERRWGINYGTFFNFAHKTADLFQPYFDSIVLDLRQGQLIHADETPWSRDGHKGYAWFFGNDDCKMFIFRHTRSSKVPLDILGTEQLCGVLITDRYCGYVSALKIARQYCLVHILRDVKKEEINFPNDEEVSRFTADIKPLLSEAISLRNKNHQLDDYLKRAVEIKNQIMAICLQEADHPAVQYIQNMFREQPERMFQWTKSPSIPADNNYAERELRPEVIARKISFGSQSDRGLKTREILMTTLHTAKCRGRDPAEFMEEALALLRSKSDTDLTELLHTLPESQRESKVA